MLIFIYFSLILGEFTMVSNKETKFDDFFTILINSVEKALNNPEKTWIKASPGDMPVHFNHLNELNDKQKSDFVYNILLIHYDRKSTVFSGVGYKEHGDKCYRSIDIPLLFDNDEEKEKIISFINANYNF